MARRPVALEPGETRRGLAIDSKLKWNRTGVLMTAGASYSFQGEGEWIDGGIRTDPDGFPSARAPWWSRWLLRLFESRRRAPAERWFCLMGSEGASAAAVFRIGKSRAAWTATMDGELTCFANDVRIAYWNNEGSVTLSVTREQ
jgi:hypothetical protein